MKITNNQYCTKITADITFKYMQLIRDEMTAKTIFDLQAIVATFDDLMAHNYELTSIQADLYSLAKLEYHRRLEDLEKAGLYV